MRGPDLLSAGGLMLDAGNRTASQCVFAHSLNYDGIARLEFGSNERSCRGRASHDLCDFIKSRKLGRFR